ncbi:hypothetical protein SD71_20825 [Cohnella kolymensis]|uniref:N-acetyltransferase domain-containing protein n=1 Tax=Cohnella kolymensis TaxID=1590652 RepID=A0ABR4ZZS8_9BACL|nr:hypothetical protein SD71_20825 [Cohnella kolymensis]
MTSREVIIRPAQLDDINGIRQVAKITWQSTYGSIYSQEFIHSFLEQAYSVNSLEMAVTRVKTYNPRKFLVAEVDGGLVGYAQLSEADNGVSELSRIYVLPEFHGQGIGRSLLNELLSSDDSIQKIFAWVEKENRVGLHFYQSSGFVFDGEMEESINGQTMILHKFIKQR